MYAFALVKVDRVLEVLWQREGDRGDHGRGEEEPLEAVVGPEADDGHETLDGDDDSGEDGSDPPGVAETVEEGEGNEMGLLGEMERPWDLEDRQHRGEIERIENGET